MTTYVSRALYLFTSESRDTLEKIEENPFDCKIDAQSVDSFFLDPAGVLGDHSHVVVSAELAAIKEVIILSMTHDYSVGIIPLPDNKRLASVLGLPKTFNEVMDLALEADATSMDLAFCNDKLMLFKAVIGWMPVLNSTIENTRWGVLLDALRRTFSIRLRPLTITTANDKKVSTVASGCMLVQRHQGDYASRLLGEDSSVQDGCVGLIVSSPFSLMEYFRVLFQLVSPNRNNNRLPDSIGYIKSRTIDITSVDTIDVVIDGDQKTTTPVSCEVKSAAARVNISRKMMGKATGPITKETFKVSNLPDEKESLKYVGKRIPFFSYASEDRFKDLFLVLNKDAQINSNYIVLMLLSALISTAGLYLDSAAVIIGAMLLAPLMAPLVSVAMGLLRGNSAMMKSSARKILLGAVLAIFSSALFSVLFPTQEVSAEMLARLNPTILDLAVAIFSGIVGAYSKSHKEIAQNLAGVAIAVALVPPLTVAGIGIGKGDMHFFLQAFLLFSTNLVGIILAAVFTFRVLGFSSVVKSRRGVALITTLTILITVPLYLSYHQIVERLEFEDRLRTDRFLVNDKYVVIEEASMLKKSRVIVLHLNLLVRDPLSRQELSLLKDKLQAQFTQRFEITASVDYRL